MYSPAAIENAPANNPANPAKTIAVVFSAPIALVPPATPIINAKLETRPSIAPKTAGRNHPPLTFL